MQTYTRTIGEPANAKTDSAKDHILLTWDPRLGVKQYKVQISSTPDFSRPVETVETDNPGYAPLMTSYGYTTSSALYWRVAGVDEDSNQGDWSQAQTIRLQPQLRVSASGLARPRRKSTVRVTVMNAQGKRLPGAGVRLSGVGVRATKRTNKLGMVTFTVKPKKKGKLLVTATMSGFQPGYGSVRVR
jgi:hypothetical protein